MKYIRSLWRHKLVRTGLILAILAIPVSIAYRSWANSSTTSTIHIATIAPVATTAATKQPLKTAYFTTQVPAAWKIQTNPAPSASRLQVVAFASKDSNAQLAIVSDALPAEGINAVGDYHLRTTDTQNYSPFSDPSLPAGTRAFTNNKDSGSLTIFMTNNGRYVSLTVSGESDQAASLEQLKSVLADWVWV